MHNVARDGGRHRGVGVLPHHRVSRLSLGVGWLVFLLFVFAFIQLFLLVFQSSWHLNLKASQGIEIKLSL